MPMKSGGCDPVKVAWSVGYSNYILENIKIIYIYVDKDRGIFYYEHSLSA